MSYFTMQEIIDQQIQLDAKKLMQFTGLCDKNKKDIYEGDIIKENGQLIIMKYRTPSFVLMHREPFMPSEDSEKDSWQLWPTWSDNIEVVGNIFENETMLQEKI